MSVLIFEDYKRFCRDRIAAMPKRGHGELARIANYLGVNPALISQIINGPKDFTTEQVLELSKFWGLNAIETDLFVLLVDRERAGTQNLKKYYESKIKASRNLAKQVKERVEVDSVLTEETKAIFYSSWSYAAARLLTEIPNLQCLDEVAARLNFSRAKTADILEFLVDQRLCLKLNDRYAIGPQRTHLDFGSPFLGRHHMNWRARALQKAETVREEDELMFTAPLTLSRKDVLILRERLLQVIQELSGVVKNSKSEALYCLNIDLFEV